MSDHHVEGDPLRDPYIVKYRTLIQRQNAELRAELAEVKKAQLTPGGRWMQRQLLRGLAAIVIVLLLLAWGNSLVHSDAFKAGQQRGEAAARSR